MKNNDDMTSTAGGIIRATYSPKVKPRQRRFGVSDKQMRLGWFIGMKERKGEQACHAGLKGKTMADWLLVWGDGKEQEENCHDSHSLLSRYSPSIAVATPMAAVTTQTPASVD